MTDAPDVHAVRAGVIDGRLVREVIARACGRAPATIVQHETLLPRFVWEATFDDGSGVVLRAEHDSGGDCALVLEAWAIERARAAGLPAPTRVVHRTLRRAGRVVPAAHRRLRARRRPAHCRQARGAGAHRGCRQRRAVAGAGAAAAAGAAHSRRTPGVNLPAPARVLR